MNTEWASRRPTTDDYDDNTKQQILCGVVAGMRTIEKEDRDLIRIMM
jgi:hypothetical protein